MTVFKRFIGNTKQIFFLNNETYRSSINKIFSKSYSDFIKLEIGGIPLKFPYVWLRDNCQCELCFHQSAKSRIIDWSGFNLNIKPKNVIQNKKIIQVTWEDGHISKYDLKWLEFRNFSTENKSKYTKELYKPGKIIWHGDDFDKIFSKHNYTDILESDEALFNWLQQFSIYGVALIQNTPHSETAIDKIIERIGFPKRTHYGKKFIVQHVTNTSNVAYLSSNLQVHTDLPYYEYCPGANLLHCLVQTKSSGGENLLSDCHYTANHIKEHYPEQYKLLTEVEVEWSDIGIEDGKEFYKLYRSPIICLDKHKEIIRINFSIPQRGTYFPESIEKVKPWYEAHSLFFELNKKFAARFKTKAGDILVFDNIRLLHGRNSYEDKTGNVRKLIGAYVDWDEIYSRLRCLKVKLYPQEGM